MIEIEQIKVSTDHLKELVCKHCKKSEANDQIIIHDKYDLFYLEIILYFDGKKATIINFSAYEKSTGAEIDIICEFDIKQEDIKL